MNILQQSVLYMLIYVDIFQTNTGNIDNQRNTKYTTQKSVAVAANFECWVLVLFKGSSYISILAAGAAKFEFS